MAPQVLARRVWDRSVLMPKSPHPVGAIVHRMDATCVLRGCGPQVLRLMTWLGEHIPAEDANPPRPAICHGDYRLDNIVFSSSNHQYDNANLQQQSFTPLAVLDWELCTLGNPWADVAYNCLPYHLPDLAVLQRLRPDPRTGRLPEGVPSEAEYLASYCTAAGVAVPSPQDWAFYLALSLFRLLAILAGVQARAKQVGASAI